MGLFGQDGSSVLCLARDNRFFPHSPRLFLRCNSSNSSATLQSVSPPPPRPPLSVALTPAGATTSLCVNARPPDFATLHPKFYLEADGFRRVVEVPAMGTTKNLEAKMLESQGTPPLSCLSVCVCVLFECPLVFFFLLLSFLVLSEMYAIGSFYRVWCFFVLSGMSTLIRSPSVVPCARQKLDPGLCPIGHGPETLKCLFINLQHLEQTEALITPSPRTDFDCPLSAPIM